MREWIRRIAELVDIKSAGNFAGQTRRHILIIFRVAAPHIGTRQPHFGAESADVRDFFLRHLVRNNENDAVTFRRRDQGEPEPGIARGRFDDRAAGLQAPSRSAASIIESAIRSLIEPVGF